MSLSLLLFYLSLSLPIFPPIFFIHSLFLSPSCHSFPSFSLPSSSHGHSSHGSHSSHSHSGSSSSRHHRPSSGRDGGGNSSSGSRSRPSSSRPPGDEVYVGKYKLVKTIGKGNFAKVKLAKHMPTGQEVSPVHIIHVHIFLNVKSQHGASCTNSMWYTILDAVPLCEFTYKFTCTKYIYMYTVCTCGSFHHSLCMFFYECMFSFPISKCWEYTDIGYMYMYSMWDTWYIPVVLNCVWNYASSPISLFYCTCIYR